MPQHKGDELRMISPPQGINIMIVLQALYHSKSLYKLRTNTTVRYSQYLRKNTKHSYLRAASTLVCTDFVIDEIERIWK